VSETLGPVTRHHVHSRPHLRRPLQSERHLRLRPQPPLSLDASRRLLGSAAHRRDRGCRSPARFAWQHRQCRRDAAVRLARPVLPLGTGAHLLPDVRDHGRRYRRPRRRRGGSDRGRRHRRARRDVWRADQWRLDEPCSLNRPGPRVGKPACPLALHRRADLRGIARGARLPVRAR
jgi:hypothetical protein